MQLTDEIKEATSSAHADSEKKMVLALKRIRTEQDYIQMLNWLYGFYAPLEELIKQQLTSDTFPEIAKRSRAENLMVDIQALSTLTPKQDICAGLPTIDSDTRALGALYVLEGSTLGGRIIAGIIKKQLDTSKGLSFFNGYGAETTAMWQSFKDFLNQPRSAHQRIEIIAAAEDTFITFKNWIDKHELQPQL